MSQPLFSPNWIALHLVNIAIANASIIIAQIAVRMEINPLRHLAMSMAALSLTLVSQVLMGRIRFPGRALLAAAWVATGLFSAFMVCVGKGGYFTIYFSNIYTILVMVLIVLLNTWMFNRASQRR